MVRSEKERAIRNRRRNRVSMAAIGLVVSMLLAVLVFQGNSLQNQLERYDEEEAALKEKIEEEKARTEEIDELKEYMKTDEYAEEVAREKLGLVKDNEIVFQEKEDTAN